MALLEINDLRTEIQLKEGVVHAVDGVTLHVDEGETLGIVGESGCGKTMTALSIMKLLPTGGSIVGGSIKLSGTEISSLSDEDMRRVRGNEIGMIFQDPLTSLNPTMTVGKQIAEAVKLHRGANNEQAMDRAAEVLNLVGLPRPAERLSDYPHQLSGGLRQRVMIAMALALRPRLLIADEATTALDVTTQAQIMELLLDLQEELGMALIMISHDLGLAASYADEVIVMYAGKIVEQAPAARLFGTGGAVRMRYTRALLDAIPHLERSAHTPLPVVGGRPPDPTALPRGCSFAPRCQYAEDDCLAKVPALAEHAPGHRWACWHPCENGGAA